MKRALLLLALIASPVPAQVVTGTKPYSKSQVDALAASQLVAMEALIPQASTVAPPPVGASGVTGTATTMYALANHTHESSVKKASAVTNASGIATFNWTGGTAFTAPPIPLGVNVLDATGSGYSVTILTNTATQMTVQVRKLRMLPATIALLSALVNYDIAPVAGSGLTVYASAGPATQ